MMDNTFPIKKTLCCTFFGLGESGNFHWDDWVFVSGSYSWVQTHDSPLVMTFLGKSGSLVAV